MTSEQAEGDHLRHELASAKSSIEALTDRVHELILERGQMINVISSLRTELESYKLKQELKRAGLLSDDEM